MLALVGPLPPPSGGMANQAIQLRDALEEAGVDVRFVRVNEPYKPAFVARVKGLRAIFRLALYIYRLWRAFDAVDLVHVMANSGWSWHLFAGPAVWVAKMRGKPVIVNYRGGEAEKFFAAQWRFVRPTLTRASSVVVPSTFLQPVFTGREMACKVIPNVLDLQRFSPRRPTPVATDKPHVVVTRNLERIYGIDTAIRAFHLMIREHPGARLTIAGSGPDEPMLRALVHELGLDESVSFSGRLTNEEVASLYESADLLLNASREDNSPNSLIEALACGVPVVSTNAGGIPFLVEDRVSALLVPVGDHAAMGAAALEIVRNEKLKDDLVRAGLAIARKFDKAAVLSAWLQEYERVLSPIRRA